MSLLPASNMSLTFAMKFGYVRAFSFHGDHCCPSMALTQVLALWWLSLAWILTRYVLICCLQLRFGCFGPWGLPNNFCLGTVINILGLPYMVKGLDTKREANPSEGLLAFGGVRNSGLMTQSESHSLSLDGWNPLDGWWMESLYQAKGGHSQPLGTNQEHNCVRSCS